MQILVISDIHANLQALQAVLAAAGPVDAIWCLGDLVGYGPNPNEVVETIRSQPNLLCVAGNHDVAIADANMDIRAFNAQAQASVRWQREQLTPDNRQFLQDLPRRPKIQGAVTLAHGSPRDHLWEYILNTRIAHSNFHHMRTRLAFIGHSHVQLGFEQKDGRHTHLLRIEPGQPITLQGRSAVLNPGSVGQPRDEDPRAAFAIFDTEAETWLPQRVEYDVETTRQRILAAGLPPRHAERLLHGW